jgi:two-component system, chemotaxis family, chemotaxis protein CheY
VNKVEKTAVIVDDTIFMRMTLKNMLENIGYKILGEGADGFDAVKLYKKHKPLIITMDITMPNKDGIEAVQEILSFDQKANVIMVSAMGQKTKVIDALTAGAKDFVVKPFQHDRILEALTRIEEQLNPVQNKEAKVEEKEKDKE